jgi:hypothetical protein
MKTFKTVINSVNIRCDVNAMGDDFCVLLYGGDLPHVGSTALSVPRPSLTGQGVSATTSILNCIGHKDDVLAKLFAETIAAKTNHVTVCVCGIHVDGLSFEDIQILYEGCCQFLEEILISI